jgi:hypothetical protein
MTLPIEKCTEVVKLYYESYSPVRVIRSMQKRYPEDGKLSKMQVHRIVKRFEQSGSVIDRRHGNTGRPKAVRSSESIEQVKSAIEETPQKSVRRLLGNITNKASVSSVYRMLRYDLKLTPYTISIRQHLKASDISSRLAFATWMKDRPDIAVNTWFSDEAHFYLNAQVNKRNCRFWGTEKPDFCIERSLYSQKLTVWAAMSSSGIIGPFFFEDENGDVETINSARYLNVLKRKFVPALRRKGADFNSIWFQQDGATPHTSGEVISWLEKTFGTHFISYRTDNVWPPHSPDLSPLDFFLWGYLKDRVYSPAPTSLEELKVTIRREIRNISTDTCTAVISNFKKRLDVVLKQGGRHLEHIL